MILDTNALSAMAEGDLAVEALLAGEAIHHLPTIVLGEYRFGLLSSRLRDQLAQWLDGMERSCLVLVVDATTARFYAEVREELRRKATPIPENDLWIAALARQHQLRLVSRDQHFDAVTGLQRLSW
ncbi:MAG: type II toxin-antitoxin system VapC family toxin [Planctomycetes bacterium]|nr:type II toxin-antitoxin system VapC family toxin [Planctomycetota bacterium]MBM4080710.1 type II toxin-antitoxin system VapC family toxin [Planctomycetota bacterium]